MLEKVVQDCADTPVCARGDVQLATRIRRGDHRQAVGTCRVAIDLFARSLEELREAAWEICRRCLPGTGSTADAGGRLPASRVSPAAAASVDCRHRGLTNLLASSPREVAAPVRQSPVPRLRPFWIISVPRVGNFPLPLPASCTHMLPGRTVETIPVIGGRAGRSEHPLDTRQMYPKSDS